jgi:diguanylate cyclase (GGDEF)-like protein
MPSPTLRHSTVTELSPSLQLAVNHTLPRVLVRVILLLVLGLGISLCCISALSIKFIPDFEDGVNYFTYTISLLVCAAACLPFAIQNKGSLRLRWSLFAGSCTAGAVSYLFAAVTQFGWLHSAGSVFYLLLFSAISGMLILIATTLFFSRITRTMAALDAIQMMLFGLLFYTLAYNPHTKDMFAENHLVVVTAVRSFYFVTAMVALPAASSPGESRFLRLLSVYLGLQAVVAFLMDQVGYQWLHSAGPDIFGFPETLANTFFAYMLVRTFYEKKTASVLSQPTLFVRNLMPLFMALGNVALAFLVLARYAELAMIAIICSLILFALRTVLLQSESAVESERLEERNRQLEVLATCDALTGVGNRRSIAAALEELNQSARYDVFALVLVDTDWFKQANDRHGHLYGDEVLIRIAEALQSGAKKIRGAHCARLGGDEFALLVPGLDTSEAFDFAEELRVGVADLEMEAGERMISISVGATVSRLSIGLTFEKLMSRADEALYRAKSQGRNRVAMWS